MPGRDHDALPEPRGVTRRSMIAASAGVATTVAVSAVSPGAAGAAGRADGPATLIAKPSTPIPADVVVAYVHDADRGHVTVVHGEVERTYKDPSLARRLLKAVHPESRGRS